MRPGPDPASGLAPRDSLPLRIGRYRVIRELGRGGTAIVYLARAIGLGGFERLFAIKMIHEEVSLQTSFMTALLNEARITSRLHHPNVISVFEVNEEAGRYFLVMDYVRGENLAQALKRTWNLNRPPPLEIAVHVIAKACEGLHAAHELKDAEGKPLGVVHRDVTPQNIIIGYDGIVRVMDFGIAKATTQLSLTRPGTIKGTVAYMSPEQVRAQPIDRRSDVFAAGVMLWETTVGTRLFKSTTYVKTAAQVLRMPVPRPSSLRADYPPRLEEIVMRALARDPDRRYSSAKALSDDLETFLAGEKKLLAPADIERFMHGVFGAEEPAKDLDPTQPPVEPKTALVPKKFETLGPTVQERARNQGHATVDPEAFATSPGEVSNVEHTQRIDLEIGDLRPDRRFPGEEEADLQIKRMLLAVAGVATAALCVILAIFLTRTTWDQQDTVELLFLEPQAEAGIKAQPAVARVPASLRAAPEAPRTFTEVAPKRPAIREARTRITRPRTRSPRTRSGSARVDS